MRKRLILAAILLNALAVGAAMSCGARTSLPGIDGEADIDGDGDAGVDDAQDAPPDVPVDVPVDVPIDVPIDVPPDVPLDGLPECDPDALYVYLVTSETDLYRYDPINNQFFLVGALQCPAAGATPFSMGVSRTGIAQVVYGDGQLFQVNTEDASCTPTPFVPDQEGFHVFGMGFAIDDDMQGETLYVAEISFTNPPIGLGTIDLDTFDLEFVGPFSETFGNAIELTSSDDGRLYGYFLDENGDGGWLVRIDKSTGTILEATHLAIGMGQSALAFAHYGGDFYVFTANGGGPTTVTRYRPSDESIQVVATLNREVVGAGVSTCTLR